MKKAESWRELSRRDRRATTPLSSILASRRRSLGDPGVSPLTALADAMIRCLEDRTSGRAPRPLATPDAMSI
jgi:hypothetical protein